ncbi:TerC family protein [Dermabacteraceae bacterium P13115]
MGSLSMSFEVVSLSVLLLILLADLALVVKRPHQPSMKECTAWITFYVGLALAFALVLVYVSGWNVAGKFVTGWLTEYALSVDNLFVFIVIMAKFSVPRKYQQEVLMVGIIIALIARALFIVVGAVAINSLSWLFYIFGIFLFYTAYQQIKGEDDADEQADSFIMTWLKKHIRVTKDYDGNKLRTTVGGKKMWTPMLLVFLTIGLTDVMFALDSIPAIFGITQDPFIVFTANLFALMGLRQLYFLLGGLMNRLVYLHYGLAAILAYIGVKLIMHALHENTLPFINGGQKMLWIPEIPTLASLGVIIGCIVVATVASFLWGPKESAEGADSAGADSPELKH